MNLKGDKTHGIGKEEEICICNKGIDPILKEEMTDSTNIQKDMRTADHEAQVKIISQKILSSNQRWTWISKQEKQGPKTNFCSSVGWSLSVLSCVYGGSGKNK